MIASDLTRDIKISVKTAIGQLKYILDKVDDENKTESVLLQFKAVQAILNKATFELLDETYRKAMAEKIASAYQNCPGNCGNEQTIERLRQLFPNFSMDEIPQKLKEAQQVDNELKKYLSQNNLDTPSPTTDICAIV